VFEAFVAEVEAVFEGTGFFRDRLGQAL
jgi:hypothetical protein